MLNIISIKLITALL